MSGPTTQPTGGSLAGRLMTAAALYPDLEGKVAVITGASAGIGAATARLLAANGVRIAVMARRPKPVEAIVEELRGAGADAVGCAGDAAIAADVERLRRTVDAELGPADIVLPFAGGFRSYTPLEDITEEEWRRVVDQNLTSTFLTVKAFLPSMMERRRGAVITITSNSARLVDVPLTASYAASKGGIVVFTRHAAKELGRHGIRVNCVAPATTMTERLEAVMPDDIRDRVTALSPLGRLGTPEDSAHAAVFLASDVASWITGITLDVAGGRVMQ
jgi:3-oxoacyl-[acyl-carrier protein] reductase